MPNLSSLEQDILTALGNDRVYGLELLGRINAARQSHGMRSLGIDSLYPALKRLEEAELIQGEWGEQAIPSDASRRRYYQVKG